MVTNDATNAALIALVGAAAGFLTGFLMAQTLPTPATITQFVRDEHGRITEIMEKPL